MASADERISPASPPSDCKDDSDFEDSNAREDRSKSNKAVELSEEKQPSRVRQSTDNETRPVASTSSFKFKRPREDAAEAGPSKAKRTQFEPANVSSTQPKTPRELQEEADAEFARQLYEGQFGEQERELANDEAVARAYQKEEDEAGEDDGAKNEEWDVEVNSWSNFRSSLPTHRDTGL